MLNYFKVVLIEEKHRQEIHDSFNYIMLSMIYQLRETNFESSFKQSNKRDKKEKKTKK